MAFGIGGGIIGLVALICLIWVIYDVWVVNRRATTIKKIVWTILALFFSIVTAIVYYLLEKR